MKFSSPELTMLSLRAKHQLTKTPTVGMRKSSFILLLRVVPKLPKHAVYS